MSAEADRILSTPEAKRGFASDDPRGWWLDSQREVRLAIDRWAGRLFDSDAERLVWWEKAKDKSPRDWLSENLQILAEQADKRVRFAGEFAREILPELPIGDDEWIILDHCEQQESSIRVTGPYRAQWLQANRSALHYDEYAGCFRLKQAPN